jgi:hypothetical protein|tara:strand:- start:627 stop:815 length:189 start_codon:yes stop_codon:yes gene_type:complete
MKVRLTIEQLVRLSRVTSLTEKVIETGKLSKEEYELFDLACKFVIKGNTHEKIGYRKRNKVC